MTPFSRIVVLQGPAAHAALPGSPPSNPRSLRWHETVGAWLRLVLGSSATAMGLLSGTPAQRAAICELPCRMV